QPTVRVVEVRNLSQAAAPRCLDVRPTRYSPRNGVRYAAVWFCSLDNHRRSLMSTLSKNLVLQNVHRVKRPGLGYVYKGTISVAALHKALRDGDVAYSLKYQRGTKDPHLKVDPDLLLPIHSDKLDIKVGRAQQMAVKYLIARAGNDYALYNPDII